MNKYDELIKRIINSNIYEILIIDIINDKLYRYNIDNNSYLLDKVISYQEYINNCSNYIYGDNIEEYINSLSINNLKDNGNRHIVYKIKDNTNEYISLSSNIFLYNENNIDYIIVVSYKNMNTNNNEEHNEFRIKYNKVIDSLGLSLLKIHNAINNDMNSDLKKEHINSILVDITKEFPEFNASLSKNATNLEGSKKSIMIIDDDTMTCSIIKKIFDNDYNVITVHNGEEAIKYLKEPNNQNNFSCIFLDLLMPVLDGYSVLDYLNDNNYLKRIPVIIISGNYDKETRNKAYSYPIADMLEKPFNVQVIKHRIDNLIYLYEASSSMENILIAQYKGLKDIIKSLVTAYEYDNYKIMQRIKKYTKLLTLQVSADYPEYNISSKIIDKISSASMYYGIGNYTLPQNILYKKDIYSEEDKKLRYSANINGAEIIKYIVSENNINIDSKYGYEIAKYYNERYDGTGYPSGISGNAIPLAAQIVAIVIGYCKLLNAVNPVDYEKIASLIEEESGKKYNPKIINSFKKVQSEFASIAKEGQ